MAIVQEHIAGVPAWVELGTSDVASAQRFYTELFGWNCNEVSGSGNAKYFMWQKNGLDVAGMYPLSAPVTEAGIPPHWLLYFASGNVDASLHQLREAKGGVLFGPFEVGTAGRSAWCVDRHGAMFAIWQAREHIGCQIVEEPGSLCWAELASPELDLSIQFYQIVFGWKALERKPDTRRSPTRYVEWMANNVATGGGLQLQPDWEEFPPHWMPYFQVSDCIQTSRIAVELGGQVVYQPVNAAGVGTFALLADPQGVRFSVIDVQT